MKLTSVLDRQSITVEGGTWPEMLAELTSQLDAQNGSVFAAGSRVWMDAAGSSPDPGDLERLVWLLEMRGVKLQWWMSTGARLKREPIAAAAKEPPAEPGSGVAAEAAAGQTQPDAPKRQDGEMWTEAALISHTLRSGQLARYAGTVIVLGDVNPGAVIVADGSVIVWGRLGGVVRAGAAGDDSAVVGALELAPSQLLIGEHAARARDGSIDIGGGAELAHVRGGKIVIEDWDDVKE